MKMSEFVASDSAYLCKEMIWDTPVIVAIDRVEGGHDVPVPNSSKTEVRKVLFFVGAKKALVLNAGHRKFLKKVFGGADTREWHGRRVLLYVEPAARFQSKAVGGIRIAVTTDRGVRFSGDDPGAKGPPSGIAPPHVAEVMDLPPTEDNNNG